MNPRLRKHILAVLHAGDGLLSHAGLLEASSDWTPTEIASEARRMEVDGLVTRIPNPLGELSTQLTTKGRGVAAELGL